MRLRTDEARPGPRARSSVASFSSRSTSRLAAGTAGTAGDQEAPEVVERMGQLLHRSDRQVEPLQGLDPADVEHDGLVVRARALRGRPPIAGTEDHVVDARVDRLQPVVLGPVEARELARYSSSVEATQDVGGRDDLFLADQAERRLRACRREPGAAFFTRPKLWCEWTIGTSTRR